MEKIKFNNHDLKSSKAVFSCKKCNQKFDDLANLKNHEKSHQDSLERLKDEILHEVKKEDKKKLSWGSTLVTAVLIILIFVSITQTVQSANILNKINSGDFKSSGPSSETSLPSSLESLPDMVGGC